jgi:hypothetical protein
VQPKVQANDRSCEMGLLVTGFSRLWATFREAGVIGGWHWLGLSIIGLCDDHHCHGRAFRANVDAWPTRFCAN